MIGETYVSRVSIRGIQSISSLLMHRSQKTKLRFRYGVLSKRCRGSSKDPEEKANAGRLFAADRL